jgi:hypothetical protein
VQKARKSGRLVLYPDGSINSAASDARRRTVTDPDQKTRARSGFAGSDGGKAYAASGPGDSTSCLKARTIQQLYRSTKMRCPVTFISVQHAFHSPS